MLTQIRKEPLTEPELLGLAITMPDFEAAIPCVQPSVRREGFATTPDVTWDDVGALQEVISPSQHLTSSCTLKEIPTVPEQCRAGIRRLQSHFLQDFIIY